MSKCLSFRFLSAVAVFVLSVSCACGAVRHVKPQTGEAWSHSEKVHMERGRMYRMHGRIRTTDFKCVNHTDLGGPSMQVEYLSPSGKTVGCARTWCVTETNGGWADVVALAELPANATSAEIKMIIPDYVTGIFEFDIASFAPYALPVPPEPTPSPCKAIDGCGRLIVDGKPYLPLGMYFENWDPLVKSNLDVFAQSPFNTIIPYSFPDRKAMDLCAERGIRVMYNANVYYGTRWALGQVASEAEETGWIERKAADFRSHPALLGWYINDEFALNMLDRLDRRYELMRRLDPEHPTWGVFMNPSFAKYFGANLDVLGVDPYPVAQQGDKPQVDLIRCATEPRDAIAAFGGKRPLWSVIQAFDWKMYCPTAKNTRAPTETDLRAMTWLEIASGANGIFYLAFTSLSYEGNGNNFAQTWNRLKRVAGEVKAKESLILSDPGPVCAPLPHGIVARTWKHDGRTVVLAANSAYTNAVARIECAGYHPLQIELGPLEHVFRVLTEKSAREFATLGQARSYVRKVKRENGGKVPRGGLTVLVSSGVDMCPGGLVFGREDSGEPGSPVVYRAVRPGESVVSGAEVPKWRREGGLLVASVPERIKKVPGFFGVGLGNRWGAERPLSLYADSGRMDVARWPNDGVRYSIGDSETRLRRRNDSPSYSEKFIADTNGVFVCDSPRMAAWAREPDLWAHGWWFFEWADTVSRVTDIWPEKNLMRIDPKDVGFGVGGSGTFFVLNAACEIDRPGEWAVDPSSRTIRAMPPADGSVPRVATADGVIKCDRLSDVSFEGFVFECSRGGGVADFTSCTRVNLRSSVVRHASGWGVRILNSRDCRVEGCDFHDIGEGGVFVQAGDFKTMERGNIAVDNCRITDYGRFISCYRPGVSLNGVGLSATHNLIYGAEHQGIFFHGDDHYLGYNILHDLCRVTDDAGAIYTHVSVRRHHGTLIEHNLISETGKHPDCGCNNGIYLDNSTSGVTMRGNVISRARYGIASQGETNVITGNVVMNTRVPWTRGNMVRLPAKVPPLGCIVSNNVAIACGAPRYDATNVYEAAIGGNLALQGDPGFCDYEGFDWDAAPGSVLERTVGDLRMREAGLYANEWRVSRPVRFGPGVTLPGGFTGLKENPEIRVDVGVDGPLPQGMKNFAYDLAKCEFPGWGKGRVVWSIPGSVTSYASEEWVERSIFLTPRYDAEASLNFMGALRTDVMTEYEFVEAIGAEITGRVPSGTMISNARKPISVKLKFKKDVPVVIVFRARIPGGKDGLK